MIFVDSSAWIAIVRPKDQYHRRAAEIFAQLIASPAPLVTSDYVINETFTFLVYHTRDLSRIFQFNQILAEAENQGRLIIKFMQPKIFQEARSLFLKRLDNKFSFVDCISFIMAKELKIKDVFSFDRDFSIMGFHLLASA